jgi:small-conductance mechanosensitive channel
MDYDPLIAELANLLAQFRQKTAVFLPNLVGAAAVFAAGLLLAKLLRYLSGRLIRNLNRLVPSARLRNALNRAGAARPASELVGAVVYWIVLVFGLAVATQILGLPVVTAWLSGIAIYLPRILAAALIGLAGLVGGILLRDLVTAAALASGVSYGAVLGRAVQVVILMVTVLIAIDQVGLDTTFLAIIIAVMAGAILFAAAFAFAFGAANAVSNILASHYLQGAYKVGQTIRIGDVEGRIVKMASTAVILETSEGRVLVPAKTFSEVVSVLLTKES